MSAKVLNTLQYPDLLERMSQLVSDYRAGEIQPRTPERIELWMKQFPAAERHILLGALFRVLDRNYIPRIRFSKFFNVAVSTYNGSTEIPAKDFWRNATFLNIQRGGNSQVEMLKIIDEALESTHGFKMSDTVQNGIDFVYVDDLVATGNRFRNDIGQWMKTIDSTYIRLHLVAPAQYSNAISWVSKNLVYSAKELGKQLYIHRYPEKLLDNDPMFKGSSDVLWPTSGTDDDSVQTYIKNMRRPVELRNPANTPPSLVFAGLEEERIILERLFLVSGCQILRTENNFPERAHPLGYENLDRLGFGSMIVTYRNCPNNTPICLWADNGESPALFPRKTNAQAESARE